MLHQWSRRASLTTRVAVAASLSVAAVVVAYSVLLRETVRGAVTVWEAERLGAIAHHVSEMVSRDQSSDYRETIASVANDHRIFGYAVQWEPTGTTGRGRSTVTVALEHAPGVVVVSADKPLFDELDRRLWAGCGLLAVGAFLALIFAVHGSVHWGLRRPLKQVRDQLRKMKRGPWATPAAALGSREIVELANELESVGHTLDRRISMWVKAERRAAFEMARLDLRNRILPAARELNVLVGDLIARGALDAAGVHHSRRLFRAVEDIMRAVGIDDAEEMNVCELLTDRSEEAPHV